MRIVSPACATAVAFVIVVAVFLAPAIHQNRVLGAYDYFEMGSPIRDTLRRSPKLQVPIQLDQAQGYGPRLAEQLRHGKFPLWSPYNGAGTPLLSTWLLSPFALLTYVLISGPFAPALHVGLLMLFSLVGMSGFLKQLKCSNSVAMIGAIAYTYCGSNVVFINRIAAVFVLPALIWAATRLAQKPTPLNWAATAFLVATVWYQGFPAAFFICVYACVAWLIWGFVGDAFGAQTPFRKLLVQIRNRAVVTGSAFAVGLLIASYGLVTMLGQILDYGTLAERGTGSLPPLDLAGLLGEEMLGTYPEGAWWSGANPVEAMSTAGAIVVLGWLIGMALVVSGRLRLGRARASAWSFFGGVGLLTLTAAFGTSTWVLQIADHIPGIADNPLGRTRFIANFALVVVAALTVDSVVRPAERHDVPGLKLRVTSGLFLVWAGWLAWRAFGPYHDLLIQSGQSDHVRNFLFGQLFTVTVAVALVIAGSALRRWSWVPVTAVGILIIHQLLLPQRSFTPAVPRSDYYPTLAVHRELQRLTRNTYRFTALNFEDFLANSSYNYKLRDLAVHGLNSREFKSLITSFQPHAFDADPFKLVQHRDDWNLNSPLLDDLAVRYVTVSTRDRPFGDLVSNTSAVSKWVPLESVRASQFTLVAERKLVGLELPLRGSEACKRDAVAIHVFNGSLNRVASVQRPGFDLLNSHRMWFAVVVPGSGTGKFTLSVSEAAQNCRIKVGLDKSSHVALRFLVEPERSPVHLVSTTQSWIYERPNAFPLISSHGTWKSLGDQPAALKYAQRQTSGADRTLAVVTDVKSQPNRTSPAVLSHVRVEEPSIAVTSRADHRTLLFVSQNADPSWHAYIDGNETNIGYVDGTLAGVFVPAGQHRVHLEYKPRFSRLTVAASILGLLTVLVSTGIGIRRRRSVS
jgi:hypothetical protein